MNYSEYSRALHLFAFWLRLNETGRKRLQYELEKQAPHHGRDTPNALIACVESYLAKEGTD